ncbi:hypothetical protein [Streptomyces fumanus]|uniref:Uncharacterized protein n=1 Tax=Streptomyces fumanus TaxID=67302 RepID=A0A919EA91_9ACTN|nr:hypothetical protein [Streptomyces fumanus]GHF33986.1 hypothetical protein GCM10018772_69520 [Streptomyces fumanus]
MVTAIRRCAECGAEFVWTSRTPNRRFCDAGCRARWWRTHRARTREPDGTADGSTCAAASRLSATHECPNCGQRITVINLLVSDAP